MTAAAGPSVKDVIQPLLDERTAAIQDTSLAVEHRGQLQLNLSAIIEWHLKQPSSSSDGTSDVHAYGSAKDQQQQQQQQQRLLRPTRGEVLEVRQ
jgi:hypothetical protein